MVAGNVTFPIYNSDGTSFNGLELKKSVYESVVMSLGDKITGDVYYPNNALVVTMKEYITYNGVKYVLVNPPTIVREGMVSDNGELKGMTKYSFTFYHPMYMLGNFPLCDVAVSSDQQRYLSENKTFFWIGNLTDFVAKLNKNLENTEWYCVINDSVSQADRQRLSEVMSFDKNTIADALKTGYETWDVPYIISIIPSTDPLYQQGKRFLIQYGLPSTEILVENAQNELVPFVFHFGQGVGLKNNSRTPRNNKIVTRIAGYGSEDNIQYGYPQIPYEGGDCQYPLYYGIVGGQRVQLIKHPFTRTHLMPSIYRETVNKKVNPMATGYDPTIELKDYYDADNTYENPIKPLEPSYEIHEFEKIKPELGQRSIVGVSAYSDKDLDSISLSSFISLLSEYYTESEYLKEKEELEKIINTIGTMSSNSGSVNTRAYYCDWSFTKDERYAYVKFESSALNFEYTVLMVSPSQDVEWDDTMDDDGNYVQSYFRITIPQLSFDLYASAAITQEMTINMRSGACLGCSFPVMVDWDDYKLNFYDADGNFAPNGSQRNYDKYPDSSQGQITLILQKETSTFGTLMPNTYQKPHVGDEFVILGISLPTTYITEAEARLDAEMKQYMRDNNVYYYDYPLKFDEHFLTTHAGILAQMDNNVIVRFDYAGTEHALYIKQVSVKYENKPLPTYDITLTDNIEVVLNQIGQVVDEVRRLHDNIGGVVVQPSNNYLRKDIDDTAYGMIRLIKGLQVGNRFVTGLLGEGGVFRKEDDGTTYLECDKLYVRMKAYFDTVEVRHYMHSAGNRVASNAGINCSRVEYIDSNGDVTQDVSEATLFRCYFRANDDGREVRNDFVVGDLAFCRETNVNTDSVDQHGYWRAVVGRNANGVLTDDGEGWIDLSVSDCQEGSGIPIAQDDIVQLGNKTDTTRQGAIIEFVSGADAPSYQIYQGINTYSLNGKNYIGLGYSSQNARAYLNVYGDAYIGDPNESSYIRYNAGTRNLEIKAKISAQSTIDGETLAQFISENTWTEEQIDALITAETDPLSDAIEDIRRQVDGNIATWFYDGEPTLQNLPASQWTTADDKNEHLGDLYYDNLTGYGYRFKYDDLNRQWSWMRITDVDVTKALADAAKAQDTADHKRRVFVVQPTPPYDAGDLWVNATYPSGNTETNEAQSKYYNDVLRCKTSKASGTTFAIADWSLASKYTDDQALEDFKANQYVTALTNGTISTDITNAQNAANTAQGTANSAATAAANAQAAAQAAEAHAATLDYVKTALKQDTVIEGGLVLSTLIALRDGSNHIWSGISGTYQSAETGTGYKGHGIAAWYGGAMVDKEVTTTSTDYAKSLFRFDGSGYVASGNLSWDKNGNVTIQGYSINATTLQVGGVGVLTTTAAANTYLSKTDAASTYLTKTDASSTYVSIAFFERLFKAYNGSTVVHPNSTSTIDNIKAMFGFWTEQYISALGNGSGGSSGGVTLAQVWSALGNSTNEQINATHLSNALSAYNPTSNFKTINGNSIIGTGNITIESSGGTVTAVKVGTTSYSPTNGVVSLPDYLKLIGGTLTGNLSIRPSGGGYTDGIRLHARSSDDGWCAVLFCGAENTGNSGTSENSWFVGANGGNFYITRNGSNGGTAMLSCASNTWYINGSTIAVTSQIPTNNNQLTNGAGYITSSALGDYLPLTGGTISDSLTVTNNLKTNYLNVGKNTLSTYAASRAEVDIVTYADNAMDLWLGVNNTRTWNLSARSSSEGYRLVLFSYIENPSFDIRGSVSASNFFGNASSATKLQTARTIWGQSFDGSANVSGAISGATTISASSNVSVGGTLGVTGATTLSSTLGVTGATTLSSTLSVSGLLTASGGITIPSGKTLTIGDAVLSWDSTNQGIKITKGLYSQTFISALGHGSSGESGVNMNTVWTALANNTNEQINASHLSTALNSYATQTWVTQQIAASATGGTVTAVKVGTTTYNPSSGIVSLPAYLPLTSGTLTECLHIRPSGGGYTDGIRLHARSSDDGWCAVLFCGAENTGNSGTSENSWFVGALNGNFYITRNGANGGTAGLACVSNTWYINGSTIAVTSQIPTNNNQLTNGAGYITSSALGDYLPLTGGTISDSLTVTNNLKTNYLNVGKNTLSTYTTSRAEIDLVTYADDAADLWLGANNRRTWHLSPRGSASSYALLLNPYNTTGAYLSIGANVYANGFIGNLDGNATSASSLSVTHYCGNVPISTTSSISTQPSFRTVYIGDQKSTTPFVNVITLAHDSYDSQVSTGANFVDTMGSWGLSFDRVWNGSNSYNSAGIYAYGTGGWGAGLVFRVKNGGGFQTGHNVTALMLRNDGIVYAPNGFSGNITGNASTASGLSVTHYCGSVAISTTSSNTTEPVVKALHVFPSGGNYNDGIRIHSRDSNNGWCSIVFAASDNTGNTSITSNSWTIGVNGGNLYMGKGGTGYGNEHHLRSVNNAWECSGTWNQLSNMSVGGTLSVTGATTLSSTLGVTGNTTLSGTLSVSKATTLSSTLGVTGAITASGGITGVPSIAFSATGHFRMDEYANLRATTNSDDNHWNVYRYDGSSAISIKASSGNIGINTTSPSYKLHVNGTFYASGNSSIGGTLGVTGATTLSSTLSVSGSTTIVGSLKAQEVEITGSNEVNCNYGGGLHLQWSSSKNVTLCYGGGNVGIGRSDASYKLHIEGVAYASTGIYSGGYVTALSDIRHKDVQGNVLLTVGEIANAPAVKFLWKDRRQEGLQVGSIAQYWQKVMPEAVVENADGELTMSYGVIALLSAISIACKVEDLERRVVDLEKENKLLKEQLNVA